MLSSLAAFIPGSHRTEEDFSKILNDENGECRWPQPAAQLMSGKAGDCFINWTTVYHTRSPSSSTAPDRKTFWLVYRRDSQPHTRDYGRKQDQLTHAYVRGRREAWAQQTGMEARLALWSDLNEEEYGFDLLDEAARRKELRRFEGAPSASL